VRSSRCAMLYTQPCARSYTPMHTWHADIPNTNTRAWLARIPTFIPVHNAIVYTMHVPHYYALMRAGYVLHSREYLECGVVGKCCSNVLRSLRAHAVRLKAVRTCVCEKNDTAHVRSSRRAIPYTQPSARSYTPIHTCMPSYHIPATSHGLHVIQVHNAIVYTMHKRVLLLRTHASRLYTALT
jgi:hypothetical protein